MAIASPIDEALEGWMRDGLRRIGEIAIIRDDTSGEFVLCHHRDRDRALLEPESLGNPMQPTHARDIGQIDEHGRYRPLKTAPTLRRGWIMRLPDVRVLREALDFFYPAMIGTWFDYLRGRAVPTHLRETLERQTGMYRFARNLGDEDANATAARLCDSKSACLKKVLWKIDPRTPLSSLPASERDPRAAPWGLDDGCIPMPCLEACTLVVSAARVAVRDSAGARDRGEAPA